MVHDFKSKSGKFFTAEKNAFGGYIINGCAVATKNFCWFGVNGKEAEKLCANIGAPANTSVKIIIDQAEYCRLMTAFANEANEAIAGLPIQYRTERILINADGDLVAIGTKIVEYKTDERGKEHIIIAREYKNAELDGIEVTAENAPQIIAQVYEAIEAKKIAAEPGCEITYHGDHEMWDGIRMG